MPDEPLNSLLVEELDRDGSLHVVAPNTMRCRECWRLHLNEDGFCSDVCRETSERRRAIP